MINHILGLKQLWLQVNGHAWFHLHGIHLPVRNGAEGAKNSKWKYMSPAGFEPTPRHDTTRGTALRTARLRYLDENLAINLLLDSWIKLIKPLRDNTGQSDCGYIKHVLLNWLVRLSLHFLSQFRFLPSIIIVLIQNFALAIKHNRFHTCVVTCLYVIYQDTLRL